MRFLALVGVMFVCKSVLGGEFRVSSDRSMMVYYLGKDISLVRVVSSDIYGERFWYSLSESYFAGPHELKSLTGDVQKHVIVRNIVFLQVLSDNTIVGVGQIEAHRKEGLEEWPREFFAFSPESKSLKAFDNISGLEKVVAQKGAPLELKSPELFLEKIEQISSK